MVINRHNYEEFFLLYVDNELEPEDRLAVELFIEQNPDLNQELLMLQQTLLPIEEMSFTQKKLLFAKSTGITKENFEEYFLLALDNELDHRQKEKVESFVLKHPELQTEFTLLAQTRLVPETIIFEQKDKLYRKEEKQRRAVIMPWIRLSIAAAIIALAAFTWIFTIEKNPRKISNSVAKKNEAATPLVPVIQPKLKPITHEETIASVDKKDVAERKFPVTKLKHTQVEKQAFSAKTLNDNFNRATTTIATTQKQENIPEQKATSQEMGSLKGSNKNNLPSISENPLNAASSGGRPVDHVNNAGSSLVTQAAYHEVDNQEDEDKDLYIGSVDINKNKLKGLFKKAANFFGRKSDKNDNERTLQIAGFEIKSK